MSSDPDVTVNLGTTYRKREGAWAEATTDNDSRNDHAKSFSQVPIDSGEPSNTTLPAKTEPTLAL